MKIKKPNLTIAKRKPKAKTSNQQIISEQIEAEISKLAPSESNLKIIEWYWLDKPFAAAVIIKDNVNYFYHVVTPAISELDFEVLNRVYHRLVDRLSIIEKNPKDVFEKEATRLISSYAKIDSLRQQVIIYYLKRKTLGYDSVDPLFKDPFLEEITCNGPDLPIYVYHPNYGFTVTNLVFGEKYADDFTSHLSELADRHLCLGEPVVEATLKDGTRLTAFYRNEVSTAGSAFALRKTRVTPLYPVDLVRLGTFNTELMALLWLFVEYNINMLIIGGTASGKTTTLNAISLFIPKSRRIVSIEDTREIRLVHTNWVPLVTRQDKKLDTIPNGIDEMYLLKRALRLRPEYLLVGEVRGEEATILFQAMNTGHIVFSTIHAGSVDEAFIRIFNPPISVPPAMILPLDIVMVQSLIRLETKEFRRCIYIAELEKVDIENRKGVFYPLYTWDAKTNQLIQNNRPRKTIKKIMAMTGQTEQEVFAEIKRREDFLKNAIAKGQLGDNDFITILESFRQTYYQKQTVNQQKQGAQ
ncbi:MAG: type II/IV secretion system ATPase subunit [Candidatus Bathyarchaeia archaeon]